MTLLRGELFLRSLFVLSGLGEDVAHRSCDNVDKLEKEWFLESERAAIADRSPQNTAQNVATALIGRNDSVGDRKAQRADVIGDDAKRDVDLFLVWIVCKAATAAPLYVRQAMRLPYNRNR